MAWQGDPRTGTGRWRKLRVRILRRDGYLCVRCGAKARDVDHVNGDHTDDRPENLQSLCQPCHKAKSAAEAAYARWHRHPRRRPAEPHPGLIVDRGG